MALIGSANIPSSSVTNALGYTPVNKAGDTMTGGLVLSTPYQGILDGYNGSYSWYYSGDNSHTVNFTCGSYAQNEVIITANQTNGGTYNNYYLRGIWHNNYTSHTWSVIDSVGSLTGSTFSVSATHNGGNQENGKLIITHNYSSGSFSGMKIFIITRYGGFSTA